MKVNLYDFDSNFVCELELPALEDGYPPVLLWGGQVYVMGSEEGRYFQGWGYAVEEGDVF